MENMEFNSGETEPRMNFYLSYLEEQVRRALKDSKATLTQCESEGRVHLIIREDLLADLLDQLQLQREGSSWSHDTELMQREMCDLDRQTFVTQDLKVEMEEMKGEREALKKEMETQKMEVCKERQILKVGKTNVELELESCLEMERAQAQELKDQLSKMEEALRKQEEEAKERLERSQASLRAQLDQALAQRVPPPPRETEHLKSQMGKISNRLRKALKDLDLQYFISEDLKVELEQVKGEKEALKKEVETQKMKVCKERQMLKVGKTNVELELESCLEMERAQAKELQDKLSKMEEALRKQEEAKEKLERSQASLRAQLDQALAQRVPHPPRETEHLKSQLVKTSNRLRKAQKDLDLQYFISEDLKVALEQVKGEKEALKKKVETQKMELCKEKQMVKVGKTNVELESYLNIERAQAQELQDKLSNMEEALRKQEEEAKEVLERSQASHRAQLDAALAQRVPSPPGEMEHLKSQMGKISNRLRKAIKDLDIQFFISEDLKVELEQMKGEKEALKKEVETQKMELCKERQMLKVSQTNVELELECCLEMERAQAHEVKDKLSKMEEALQEQEEGKTILERSQAAHRAQLEMQDQNNKNLMAALEKKFEQQLESRLNEWKEDKSSLLQATESLKLTQQEKEQEWERTESSMRSQLEDLQSELMKKQKKKKKWYRKLLPGCGR